MIDDLDDEIDQVQGTMDALTGKLHKMLKTKNNCQLGTILMMMLVAFGLLALILYT